MQQALKDSEAKSRHLVAEAGTARKQAEVSAAQSQQALKDSEARYRCVVEQAAKGIVILQDGTIKYASPHLAEMWNGGGAGVVGKPFADYVHADARPAVLERYRRGEARKPVPANCETVLRRRDGGKLQAEFECRGRCHARRRSRRTS